MAWLYEDKPKKVQFISFVEKQFKPSESGDAISYYVLNFFPIKEDGTVIKEPDNRKVRKESKALFENIQEGEKIAIRMGAYVEPKAVKVCDVKVLGRVSGEIKNGIS